MRESEKWKWSRSVVSNPQQPHGLQPTRLLRPWDFPGKRTGVGCHCLLHQYLLGFMKHKFGKCCLFHHCFSLYHLSCRQGLLEVTSFQSQTPEMGTLLIPSYSQGITSPPGLGQVLHPSLGPVQDWEDNSQFSKFCEVRLSGKSSVSSQCGYRRISQEKIPYGFPDASLVGTKPLLLLLLSRFSRVRLCATP